MCDSAEDEIVKFTVVRTSDAARKEVGLAYRLRVVDIDIDIDIDDE